ncbi:MAG: hypothetical protein OEQ47_10415 [Acidimicrobiia bacterium]|nr:hypothetical protein [Acidimicrobiia bacterium]
MSRMFGVLVVLMSVTACQQQPVVVETTIPIPTTATTSPRVESTTTSSTSADPQDDGCFGEDPPLSGDGFLGRFESDNSDSQNIAGFNWSETGECAALILAFRSEAGAPAVDPPEFRAEYLRHTAVVRLELGQGVAASAVSEQAIDTELLESFYVAYDPAAGSLVVDVHLAAGAEVRVRPASSPARIIVEIEADGRPVTGAATIGEAVVLFAPATSMPPVLVQGYGRAGIEISASFVSSTRVLQDTLFLDPSPTLWTTFEWTVRDFQPGPVSIRVGDAAPIEFVSR